MELKEILKDNIAALIEYYDNSEASDEPNKIIEEVKSIMGQRSAVYRINVTDNERERLLVHLDKVPAIILYRNHREELRITSNWPTAEELAERLKESMEPAGAVSPLKGRHRD